MAPIDLYDTSVGLYIKSCHSLRAILIKAKDHAGPEGNTSLASARLYEDMLPLSFQVQLVSNLSKKATERIVPQKAPYPVWEDNETTLDELIARVDKTLDLLQKINPADVLGKDDEVVEVGMGTRGTATAHVKGYVLGHSLPNIFFHVTAAYAILRSKGVPLGKSDYLGPYLEGNLLTPPK